MESPFKEKILTIIQSRFGFGLLAIIYSFGLYLAWVDLWLVLVFSIIGFQVFRRAHMSFFIFISLFYYLSFDEFSATTTLLYTVNHVSDHASHVSDVFLLLVKLCVAAIYVLLFYLFRRYFAFASRYIVLISVCIYIATLVLIKVVLPEESSLQIFLWMFIYVFSVAVWNFAYISLSKFKPNWSQMSLLLPMWRSVAVTSAPIHRGIRDFEYVYKQDGVERTSCQISGLRLLYWSLLIRYTGFFVSDVVFGTTTLSYVPFSFHLPNYFGMPFDIYYRFSIPLWKSWMGLFANSFIFLTVNVASLIGIMVSVARMCGFRFYRNTYKPYLANSFHDFFNRVFFFYNELLINFFFYPFWKFSKVLKLPKKTRLFLVTFFTVLIGGEIIHFMRVFRGLENLSLIDMFSIYAGRLPYFFLLGLFSAISVVSKGKSETLPKWYIQGPRVFFYFALYSICTLAQSNYTRMDFVEQIKFFFYFFGW